ncbi:hypothetical protein O1611_g10475 [Lasiodiplodia mahajangana]|uniref:Uncharacterized protein n=1 Tax=Lasiodiplodia mahajangana TaxID=1108764 RepID=A0ACC2IY77_9PEZI|nr:hypothetical protein O1611_g10475 [Lasiodiplodia mahajangana]
MSVSPAARVAVLYQALEPPLIDGVRKPKKPGGKHQKAIIVCMSVALTVFRVGYQDSGADIAFTLGKSAAVEVVTPSQDPNPADMAGWCFPDTEEGILHALRRGVTHLWANTILFTAHPLQQSQAISKFEDTVRVVGQGPSIVQKYDDKEYVNELLRQLGGFTMPRGWTITEKHNIAAVLKEVEFPLVAKPIRGRGSQGVKVCYTLDDLIAHAKTLFENSSSFMVEEFLGGEEVTVTVIPPTQTGSHKDYWSLPVVARYNHQDGVAPYNGVVAVVANSRVLSQSEEDGDPHYAQLRRECEQVGRILGVIAPIRIDARRYEDSKASKFVLFDINMKPNMTGPGRPGRDDQASLTLLAAEGLGWDYLTLLQQILDSAQTLKTLKSLRPR